MRLLPVFALAVLTTAASLPRAFAQGEDEADLVERRTASRTPRPTARLMRWELGAGTGLTAGVLTGVPQAAPTLQVNAGFMVTPRLTVGLAFSQASYSPAPYVDQHGVVSRERTSNRHFGVRAKGIIVRQGILQVYGGLQLGVTTSDATYSHNFPEDLQVESEEVYLANRASPFYDPGSQVGAIGFVGVSARLFKHVEVYTELGNNLALLNVGAALVF